MVIHMFAFRWKSGTPDAQKERALQDIIAFRDRIPGLIEVAAGHNISPRGGSYAFGGVMKFSDQAALNAYNVHPAHQELLAWLVPLIDAIEVDFPA